MNEISKSKSVELLLVEDNPVDIKLTTRALKKGKLLNHLHVVRDGVEAMDFLHNEGEFADVPRPDLILLDLNMPRKDGREVLSDIKNDDELKYIPVIVLTTSDAEQDVLKSYNLHANSYITKPVDFDQFVEAIRKFEEFWFAVVRLPANIHEL